jgi:hypothetical protein
MSKVIFSLNIRGFYFIECIMSNLIEGRHKFLQCHNYANLTVCLWLENSADLDVGNSLDEGRSLDVGMSLDVGKSLDVVKSLYAALSVEVSPRSSMCAVPFTCIH